jgi:hypothetical protein
MSNKEERERERERESKKKQTFRVSFILFHFLDDHYFNKLTEYIDRPFKKYFIFALCQI